MAVKLCDLESFVGEVDSFDHPAHPCHRLAQNAPAATDIQHLLAGELSLALDPGKPQRIHKMQRAKFSRRIPPAMSKLAEFGELLRIGVGRVLLHAMGKQKRPCRSRASLRARRGTYFCRVPTTSTSTRLFFARPSAVLLLAIGC